MTVFSNHHPVSDDDLIARIARRDVERPLAELHRRYGRRVQNFVRAIVRDEHLAEDVTTEVFAKVLFKCHLYTPGTKFHAWLFEIARNQALSALRAARRLPIPVTAVNGDTDTEGDPLDLIADHRVDQDVEENEMMAAFERAVGHLPPRYREVFDMCVRRGVLYREAAERLGIPDGTVAIRIMRARKRLFDELAVYLDSLRMLPACAG